MRIAIVGLGVLAREFVRALEASSHLELTAVVDLDQRRVEEFAGPSVRGFTSHHDLVAAQVCDAVVVALPNHVHFSVVADLVEAGLHVCCEKPLTLDPAEAGSLSKLASERGLVLRTALHRRFNRHLVRLREEVEANGSPPARVEVRYLEDIREHTGGEDWYLDPERCGGGCIVDNGPNALDMARVVVGELALEEAVLGDVRSGVEYYAQLGLRGECGEEVRVELDWAYEHGELKDVRVHLEDGRELVANMLEGFVGFKSSLDHEYAGILDDFAAAVAGATSGPDQVALAQLVNDAVRLGRRTHVRLRMPSKLPVRTSLVRLLFHETVGRGMRLAPAGSACISRGEIHELVVTTDDTDRAGAVVDHVAYVGFIEFLDPAMLTRGDTFWVGDRLLGEFAGYDESHMPNHLNLVLRGECLVTAEDLDLRPADVVVVREGPQREFLETSDPGSWTVQR